MPDWITIVLGGGTAGLAAAAVLVFLAKTWITERLSNAIRFEYEQRLEAHKADLAKESGVALERLRADLQIAGVEHQIRFSRLHEKVATVIADTYAALVEIMDAATDYVSMYEPAWMAPKAERRERLNEALRSFRTCFRPRGIYLTPDTVTRLRKIDGLVFEISHLFAIHVEQNTEGPDTQQWLALSARLSEQVYPALADLEEEFRRHLGVGK